jgi:hypothetical protein
VPVHVIAPLGSIAAALRVAGFTPGWTPSGASLGDMAWLHGALLRALHAGPD